MITAGSMAGLGGAGYAFRSNALQISHEQLVLSGITRNLRVVAVSDLHAPCWYASSIDLINIINAEKPDIFVIAGDTIDKRGNENIVQMFNAVKSRFAKVATLGNWEYLGRVDLSRLRDMYKAAGISLLVNQVVETPDLKVVGLDDLVSGSPDYEAVAQVSNAGRVCLVISHCPAAFDSLRSVSEHPLVVISGHTHGGQIAPFGFTPVTPRGSGSYLHGWYYKDEDCMYVMRGIGTTPWIPLRIGAKPELLVLDLVSTRT